MVYSVLINPIGSSKYISISTKNAWAILLCSVDRAQKGRVNERERKTERVPERKAGMRVGERERAIEIVSKA